MWPVLHNLNPTDDFCAQRRGSDVDLDEITPVEIRFGNPQSAASRASKGDSFFSEIAKPYQSFLLLPVTPASPAIALLS